MLVRTPKVGFIDLLYCLAVSFTIIVLFDYLVTLKLSRPRKDAMDALGQRTPQRPASEDLGRSPALGNLVFQAFWLRARGRIRSYSWFEVNGASTCSCSFDGSLLSFSLPVRAEGGSTVA